MRHWFCIGLIVLLAAVVIAAFPRTWDPHANRGKPQLAQLTVKTRTVCVGRFLIDMPEQAQLDVGRASQWLRYCDLWGIERQIQIPTRPTGSRAHG